MNFNIKTKITFIFIGVFICYLLTFHAEIICPIFSNKLGCYEGNIDLRYYLFGLDNSIGYLNYLFDREYIDQSECHTLGHVLGRSQAKKETGITEAMEGDKSFCGWAYFHGLMEGLFGNNANHGSLSKNAQDTCRAIPEEKFIDTFNCFHALGHGLYSVDYDLLNSLERCKTINPESAKEFCYDGVFMANTFPGWGKDNKYIKSDQPIFPCDILDSEFKTYCYWRNVTINIFQNNLPIPEVPIEFSKVFWNGFGRETDSRMASDILKILEACSRAGEYEKDCISGAAKHMIFYDRGSISRAEAFCKSADNSDIVRECLAPLDDQDYPGIR